MQSGFCPQIVAVLRFLAFFPPTANMLIPGPRGEWRDTPIAKSKDPFPERKEIMPGSFSQTVAVPKRDARLVLPSKR